MHLSMLLLLPAALCAPGTDARFPEPGYIVTAEQEAAASDSLRRVWDEGATWPAYLEAVNRRRELWQRNWTNARIPEDLLARARAAGTWRLLVITEPGCSDSVNSVPYIARLVEETAGLELRLVSAAAGRPWLQTHRTPDGRAATPTVLILDENHDIRGCWVEQPAALQTFWLPIIARGETSRHIDEKMAWYARDEGRETLRELVRILEAARTDSIICPRA